MILEILLLCLVIVGIWCGLVTVGICKDFIHLMQEFVDKITKIEEQLELLNKKEVEKVTHKKE